jgi:uncharacterized membrane protein
MTSMWVIRGILVALTAALAIALIVRGNVVIGALLGAIALMRAIVLVRLHGRRELLRRRLAQRRNERF